MENEERIAELRRELRKQVANGEQPDEEKLAELRELMAGGETADEIDLGEDA